MTRYYILGKEIHLGKIIGEGGEGKVFLSSNSSSKALKIYSDGGNQERAKKVQKMVSLELAKKSNLIAFPEDVITSESGEVVGFSMNFVNDHHQVHNLYGVKSRKQLFPEADYRFLVRVATNIARAIAQVHSYPCVIGDINHSGILVSRNATVALIDADSFQLKDDNNFYPCVVGVPDYTPPELQGRSLRSIERTHVHDQFGLAVLIFHILIMGRHPFSGVGGDLLIEQCIEKYLFAYSKSGALGIKPPPGVPGIYEFPDPIASAFEYSFSSSSALKRTTALEWVSLLEEMEISLVKCSINTKHYYPHQSKACLWCKMENVTGAILFNSGVTLLSSSSSKIDMDKILLDLHSFNMDELNLYPKLPIVTILSSSLSAKKNKLRKKITKISSLVLWSLMFIFICIFSSTKGSIVFLLAIISGISAYSLRHDDSERLIHEFQKLDEVWNLKLYGWRERVVGNIFRIRFNLEKTISELKEIDIQKDLKLKKLIDDRHEKQLQDFLDSFLIMNSKIKSVSPSLIASLRSHGIESAADIEYNKIRRLPQFGDIRTKNLVAWRQQIEKKFRYNSSPTANEINTKNQVINEFELKMRDKKELLNNQKKIFDQARKDYYDLIEREDTDLSNLHFEIEQLKSDFRFLNLPVPQLTQSGMRLNRSVFTSRPQGGAMTSQSHSIQSQNKPSCPRCSNKMVHRWGKRGGFWGCSKYPSCTGTRNL